MLLNGPESFTPDGNFILGEAPELAPLLRRRRLQLRGHRQLGRRRAGWSPNGSSTAAADRPLGRRHPPLRPVHGQPQAALAERTGETLGLHYAMRWPRQELETARPLRTSPLYDLLAAKGAVFGAKNGWERANYFVRADAAKREPAAPYPHTLEQPHWLADVIAEQRATREAVALYDQTSFGKLLLQGRDALARARAPLRQRDRRRRPGAWSTRRC